MRPIYRVVFLLAAGLFAGCNLPVTPRPAAFLSSLPAQAETASAARPANPGQAIAAIQTPQLTGIPATALPDIPIPDPASPASASLATSTVIPTLLPLATLVPTLPDPEITRSARPALPGPTPTYASLRGSVLQLSNCRYGPGAAFLYKYGLLETSYMEVIGRDPTGKWILVRAIGGTNPCWLSAKLMKLNGDVMSLKPLDPDVILGWSPYYGPPKSVSAARKGNEVTVFWERVNLRAGDDSEQVPYLIEAWVCANQQIVFMVVGSYSTAASVIDEPGCSELSHARLYAAEKHGYTKWVEVPWP